jgi:hypothetical protein
MKYMLLLYETEGAYEGEAGRKTLEEIIAKHMKLAEDLVAAGVEFSGHELQPTAAATTIRTDAAGGKTVHDGPFAETREQLGGYYIIDVADLAAATEWARKVPIIPGGKVEIRPVGAH